MSRTYRRDDGRRAERARRRVARSVKLATLTADRTAETVTVSL